MKVRIRTLCFVALTFATGCSPHAGGIVPTTPASQPSSGNAGAAAKISIVVPRAASAQSARRRPQYVSPSSAQLDVAVDGGTAVSYGLSPSTPGCTVFQQTLSCVFAIAAPPGYDAFALNLTDGAGKVLSRNVVNATLTAGASTPVNVTLAGVAASVAIVPGAGATIEGSAAPAYHIPGLFAQPIEVEALDSDGNVIIGPGAPKISAPTVGGGTTATIVSANTLDPNAYILKANGNLGGQTISVTAAAQGIPLNDGTTSPPVSASQAFTYTPALATVAGRVVNVYSIETGNTIATFNICPGLCSTTFASGILTDLVGNLYVAVTSIAGISQSRTVNIYATGSEVQTGQLGTSNGVTGAIAMAVDKNNMLYVLNAPTGFGFGHHPASITEYAAGATTPTHSISGTRTGMSNPVGIAVDGSGNVYASDAGGFINVYGAGTQTTPRQTLSDPQLASPDSMAFDSAGGLYVTDTTNGYIAYFAPGSTSVTNTLSDPSFGGSAPSHLMMDPSGNIWISVQPASIEELSAASLPNTVSVARVLGGFGALSWIP